MIIVKNVDKFETFCYNFQYFQKKLPKMFNNCVKKKKIGNSSNNFVTILNIMKHFVPAVCICLRTASLKVLICICFKLLAPGGVGCDVG